MAGTLAELNVVIGAQIDEFEAAMSKVQSGIGRVGDYAKSAGESLTKYVTLPLTLLGGAALAAYGKIDSLQRGINAITTQDLARQGVTGLDAVGEAAQLTKDRIAELNVIARAPGIGFEQAIRGDIRLRAVGISARDSAKDLKEFANAVATSGGSASDFDRVTVQLGQLAAKGKVLSQDLRPIIEAAPAVAQALQKLYGTIDSEDISKTLKKQGKSSGDFINVLTDELAKLPRVTGGFSNQLENFEQGAVQNAARLGESLNKAFNLEGLLDRASKFVDGLTDAFTSLDPAAQKLIFGFAAAAAAAGPLLFGFGAIAAAIPSVVAGLEVLGLASTAALGPIGIGAAAVAAAAFLIIDHWDELVGYFSSSGEGGRLFSNLADSITDSIAVINQAFASLNGGGNLGDLVSAAGFLQAAFRDVAVGITAVSDVAGGAIGAVVKLFSGDLVGAAKEAKRAIFGLIDPLANLLGFTKAGPADNFAVFFKLADAVKAADEAALDGALSNNELTGSLEAAAGAAGGLGGILANLRDRLKEVKEQRETETTRAAIAADNELVKSLQAQIDKLLGVDKGSKAAADAIAKLRQELARLSALDGLLGNTPTQMDVLQRRATTLEGGLKKLVDAGVSTASKAFQGFATDLGKTDLALAKIQASSQLEFRPIADIQLLPPANLGEKVPALIKLLGEEFTSHPFAIPLTLDKIPAADVFSAQQAISKGFAEAGLASAAFGNSFDLVGAKAAILKEQIQKLISEGVSPLDPAFQKAVADQKAFNEESKLTNSLTEALTSGLTSAVSGLAQYAGKLAVGAASTSDFAGTLLGLLGDLATKVGEAVLSIGIGLLAAKYAISNPYTAIIAGIALIGVGAALGSISSNLGTIGTGGAGGGGLASQPKTNYGSGIAASQQPIKIEAVFTIRGQDLVAVGRVGDYRELRTR